ncbi:EndoU domain-containing protein [Clostridium sp. AN503]|uniref:EndoU domain-containing protein n=1 Tax=Clostridium sp. AN503 TaxID=3160598 RepID=UPI0034583C93
MKNICDDCEWTISEYHYTYDDRGFIVGEDVTESLYAYAWDDKHDGKHENWHDDKFPHGDKHINKHAKDGIYNFQIIGTKRSFEYDDDGKLIRATEKEDRQGTYVYDYEYDDMGNRTFFKKSRNGVVQESAEYTYNAANQMVAARLYDGKHYKDVEYTYDADGNRVMQEEVKPDGNRKVELTYDYSVENRLKAVSDKNDLLVAMAYDGDGNRIFQLNYNLHTDDDWKGNSGNGNGNNKDNSGSGNKGNNSGNGTGSKKGILTSIGSFFGMDDGIEESEETIEEPTASNATARKSNGNKDKDKGNNGNDKNNGKGNGNGNSGNNGNGNSGNHGNGNGNTSTGGNNDNNGNANGNTNNTGGSQNQSGILFPIDGEVSELEAELIGMIKTTGKEKNYELVEYVNDVNREHVEVLMELNINGIMDTAYSYGNERLTSERFTEWTGYYTYDPRGSVTGVTDSKGMIWQSYRYNVSGDLTFGKPQYNNVYSYNAESYNPNMESQYLRARYYNVPNGNFLTEDSYLGNITDPLTLNRYNYVKSSPLNYTDPSGHYAFGDPDNQTSAYNKQDSTRNASSGSTPQYQTGSPNYSTSPYTKQSACKEISDEIKRHQGALLGAGVGVAIILITAATGGAPLLAVVGASAAYAGSGLIIGGALQKGIDSAYIAHKLKTEYGINVAEYQDIEVSQLPQEAQALCEQFEENGKDMETYLGEGTALSAAGAVIYEAGMLLDRIGPTVKEASKSAFERIKSWINGVTKGRSGTNTTSSNISPEMEEKILEGQRVGTSNKIIGGHSSNTVNNNSPNFAVEEVKINPDGTKVVKYYKQFPDGNVSRLKTSTLFPESWSDNEIIDAVQNIADSKPIGTRPLDGQTLHRGNINGVEIDVIKQGNDVISAYPVGGKPTPGFDPVN